MGLFDIFKKKNVETLNNTNEVKPKGIISLTNGELLDISSVPDEVFSQKMMGDGFAFKSNDGVIVSPVSGNIEMVFETKHAIGIKTEDDLDILIHMGIDTVNLKGEGFEIFVSAGDKVKAGDKLAKMDLPFIIENAKSDITPVIFTNLEDGKAVKVITGEVKVKEEGRIEII